MYAVFETGGKQYRVTEGDVVFLERLNGETGTDVKFDKVLACSNEIDTEFGTPYLGGVSLEAKILGHGKDKKIVIFKYKAKKGYRKKQGHRQPYTKVRIERIISDKFGVASYAGDDEAIVAEAVEELEPLAETVVAADVEIEEDVVVTEDVEIEEDVEIIEDVEIMEDVEIIEDVVEIIDADDAVDVEFSAADNAGADTAEADDADDE